MTMKCLDCGSIMVRDGHGGWYYCEPCSEAALTKDREPVEDDEGDSIMAEMFKLKRSVDKYNEGKK